MPKKPLYTALHALPVITIITLWQLAHFYLWCGLGDVAVVLGQYILYQDIQLESILSNFDSFRVNQEVG